MLMRCGRKSASTVAVALLSKAVHEHLLTLVAGLLVILLDAAEPPGELFIALSLGVLDVGLQLPDVLQRLLDCPDQVVVLVRYRARRC